MLYKTNFLKKVILKIDFDKIELGKLKPFLEKSSSEFPIIEEKKGAEGVINFNFKTKEVQQDSASFAVWDIYNSSRTVKIQINPMFLVVEYIKYEDFSNLLSRIDFVKGFLEKFKIKTIKRLGLRFINEVKVEDKKELLDWTPYIEGYFLGPISYSLEKTKPLARAMGALVFKEDFGNINFNYGLWNSSYPNVISDKMFILDFDAYSKFPLDTEDSDLKEVVTEYHNAIKSLFETVIKEDLRKIMRK